ncbi:sulfurtransferase complex subunit TusB, partial [Pseudomonas sp. CrR25]|nr:sulfurtransferase complex subunit TusB [Pseudomonas sp. CrR25]
GLLLSGDAVYALLPGTAQQQALELMAERIALFALDEDLSARGLQATSQVQPVDYPGFVALSCRFDKVNSWL